MASLSNHPAVEPQTDFSVARIMEELPAGSQVAVLSFVGSLCPITVAHVAALLEAKALLSGQPPAAGLKQHELASALSMGRERYSAAKSKYLPDKVIALVSVNSDAYVMRKVANKVLEDEKSVSHDSDIAHRVMNAAYLDAHKERVPGFFWAQERKRLVQLATAEYPWIEAVDNAWIFADELIRRHGARLRITRFEMDGADVALKKRTWRRVSPDYQFVAIGRPPSSPTDEDGTLALLQALDLYCSQHKADKADTVKAYFHVSAELPAVSSSAVRCALRSGDLPVLRQLLHEGVLQWLLEHGFVNVQQKSASKTDDSISGAAKPTTTTGNRTNRVRFEET